MLLGGGAGEREPRARGVREPTWSVLRKVEPGKARVQPPFPQLLPELSRGDARAGHYLRVLLHRDHSQSADFAWRFRKTRLSRGENVALATPMSLFFIFLAALAGPMRSDAPACEWVWVNPARARARAGVPRNWPLCNLCKFAHGKGESYMMADPVARKFVVDHNSRYWAFSPGRQQDRGGAIAKMRFKFGSSAFHHFPL